MKLPSRQSRVLLCSKGANGLIGHSIASRQYSLFTAQFHEWKAKKGNKPPLRCYDRKQKRVIYRNVTVGRVRNKSRGMITFFLDEFTSGQIMTSFFAWSVLKKKYLPIFSKFTIERSGPNYAFSSGENHIM